MSTDLAEVQQGGKLTDWLANEKVEQRIDGLLQGTGFDAHAFIARMVVNLNVPALDECTMASKYNAVHKCAVLALFPDLQHVAMVPKNIKVSKKGERDEWEKQVVVVPQWQGYKTLMERDPQVWEVNPTLVHVEDQFSIVDGRVNHAYNPLSATRIFHGFKDLVGGYVRVDYRDNRHAPKYEFCTADYIQKCKGCAETDAIWNKWFEGMCRKTLMRAAWSRRIVNFDPILQKRLIELDLIDDDAHNNDPLRGVTVDAKPMGLPASAPPQSRAAAVVGKLEQKKAKAAPKQTAPPEEETTKGRPEPEATEPDKLPPQEGAAPPAFDEAKASRGWAEFKELFKVESKIPGLKNLLKYIKGEKCPIRLSEPEMTEALMRIDEAIINLEQQS